MYQHTVEIQTLALVLGDASQHTCSTIYCPKCAGWTRKDLATDGQTPARHTQSDSIRENHGLRVHETVV